MGEACCRLPHERRVQSGVLTSAAATVGLAVPVGRPAGFVEPAPSPAVGSGRFVVALGLTAQFPADTVVDPVTVAGPGHAVVAAAAVRVG